MKSILLALHSMNAVLLILVLLAAIVRLLVGVFARQQYGKLASNLTLVFSIAGAVQVLPGAAACLDGDHHASAGTCPYDDHQRYLAAVPGQRFIFRSPRFWYRHVGHGAYHHRLGIT